jgi:hypothetical protein
MNRMRLCISALSAAAAIGFMTAPTVASASTYQQAGSAASQGSSIGLRTTATSTSTTAASSPHIVANLRESFTIPAGKGTYTATIRGVSFTAARNATANYCDIDSQTLLSEATVYGVASISCADEVYAAAVGAALYYGTTEESYNTNAEYNTFFVTVNTTAPLQAGTWQTEALADVYWTSPSSYTQYGPSYSSAYWDY